jgi:hypothetical protein
MFSLQLNKEWLSIDEVGAAPLMFDGTADIEIAVDVADLELEVEFNAEDIEADGLAVCFVVESRPLSPPLLPPVALLEGLVEMSVIVDDGVVGPSRLCT